MLKKKKQKKRNRVVFNMDSECFFYFWVYKNGQRHSFVTVVLFMLNMNIVSCWNPENDVAKKKRKKKKSNNFRLPVCVFSRSVLISQKWSLSPALSASIFV